MKVRWSITWLAGLAAGLASGLAQGPGGGSYGGWGTGAGGGTYGAATVARVNVAPVAGASWGGGGGAAGVGNLAGAAAGGGGGLFGVTRPTFMGEANAVAAGFFGNAGVPVTGPVVAGGVAAAPVRGYARARGPGSVGSVPTLPRLAAAGRPATSRPRMAGTAGLPSARADRAGPLTSPALTPPSTTPAPVALSWPGFAPRHPARSPSGPEGQRPNSGRE